MTPGDGIKHLLDTVICEDSTKILPTLPDNSIDAILTDPPYNTGMKKVDGAARLRHFFNDNYTQEEYNNLVKKSCYEFHRVLKDGGGGNIYINWKEMGTWKDALEESHLDVKNVIVWDKCIHGLNYQNYAYTYELIIYFTKGKHNLNNKEFEDKHRGYYKDIWHIQRTLDTRNKVEHHETIKNNDVLRIQLRHLTQPGDIVLDPFFGTGTTGVVCKQFKRHFIGIEINPDYCKTAKERLANVPPLRLEDYEDTV